MLLVILSEQTALNDLSSNPFQNFDMETILRSASSLVFLDFEVLAGGVHILVSSSAAAHHHPHAVGQGWAELLEVGEGVGGL